MPLAFARSILATGEAGPPSPPAGYIEYEDFDPSNTPVGSLVGWTRYGTHNFYAFGTGGTGVSFTRVAAGHSFARLYKNGAYDAGFGKKYAFVAGRTYQFQTELCLNMGTNRVRLAIGTAGYRDNIVNLGEWAHDGCKVVSKTWVSTVTGEFFVNLRSVTTDTTGLFALLYWRITES